MTDSIVKPHRLNALAAVAISFAFCLLGCSDPSDQVHKTDAADPQKPAGGSTVGGKPYVIRAESTIGFVGSKVTGSHTGGFKSFSGVVHVADGKIVGNPEIKIGMDSIWSDNDRLTGHLKSADFFDTATHPVSTFTVTKVEASGTQHQVTGNLKLHGVAKSISFPASIQVAEAAVSVKADFAINRKDFNINYPGRPNDLIRDNVVLKLDFKATPGPARPEDQPAM
jgi:polyisoprenoid-binding protein YceI